MALQALRCQRMQTYQSPDPVCFFFLTVTRVLETKEGLIAADTLALLRR
jgi:hypothetical protein